MVKASSFLLRPSFLFPARLIFPTEKHDLVFVPSYKWVKDIPAQGKKTECRKRKGDFRMSSHEPRKVYSIEKTMKKQAEGKPDAVLGDLPSSGNAFEIVEALAAIRADIEDIKQVTGAGSPNGGLSAEEGADLELRIELAQMVKSIAKAKTELAQIRHPHADDDRIVEASGELDAIVMATEGATNDILEATESIEKEITHIAALAHEDEDILTSSDKIASHLTRIMEACNFQDITGQRINKVVTTMQFIEERIRAMIDIWGIQAFEELPLPQKSGEEADPDADLLSGPQQEGAGITQDEIDKLFD